MKSYPKNFQKVVDYLSDLNVNVMIDCVSCYIKTDDEQTICIHHNYNLEKNGLITLLHEVGHVLQDNQKWGPNHYKNIDDMENPKEYNMYQFMNEVDAWNRGLEVAKQLNIPIDRERWGKQQREALLTYYV
jgi:hypothetical protein